MSLPLHLPIGCVLLHEGRRVRFEGERNSTLRFSDRGSEAPLQVQRAKARAPATKD